jgi:hypothetical protein
LKTQYNLGVAPWQFTTGYQITVYDIGVVQSQVYQE